MDTEEYTPQLFSEEIEIKDNRIEEQSDTDIQDSNESLFDQTSHEDEDFEIPAFLRKQKF